MIRRCFCWLSIVIGLTACAVNPAERNNVGIDMFGQAAFAEAVKIFQAAQVLSPDSPEPYFNAAAAFMQLGELNKAIDALNQALKTADPDLAAKAYYNLGNVYYQLNDYNEAINAYKQALLLDPNDNDARYNLELALIRSAPPPTTPSESPLQQNLATDDIGEEPIEMPTSIPQNNLDGPSTENPVSSDASMTVEEASRLLDAIQQNQATLRDGSQAPTNSVGEQEKDW